MLKYIILIILAIGMTFCFSVSLEAMGLSTTFSEVLLENLEIGKTYSTKETANLPLNIVNTSEEPVNLKMELLLPQPQELKGGFEPIPDLSWIRLEKTEFKEIKSKEIASSDVVISIPNDQRYYGKKFQVFIWTHTAGQAIGVGLKSKLLFTIKK